MMGVGYVFLPLLISGLILTLTHRGEKFCADWILRLSAWVGFAFLALILGRVLGWVPEVVQLGSLFDLHHYSFDLVFLFDLKALCLLGLSSYLYWVIVRFSRVYLHREEGFHRFFRTLFLSHFALNLIATAGNFDLFFVGWEVLGLTSFLLISFYRDRATPIWNGFRTYIVYRICDIGILLAAFLYQQDFAVDHMQLQLSWVLGLAILFAALGKSAQFPFSFWLPRALEGPTPSSAVFYGALSIHAGIFLLLRTESLWMPILALRIVVFMFGFLSLVVGSFSGRAQANIKGQIGYAAIAQVGVMFMELALGLDQLVLIHLCSHAVLRAYQFLTSPSVVTHFIRHPIHEQSASFVKFSKNPLLRRLSIGEFFLEEFWISFIVEPLKKLGSSLNLLALAGGVLFALAQIFVPGQLLFRIMILSLIFSIKAVAEKNTQNAMLFVLLSLALIVVPSTVYFQNWNSLLVCALGLVPGVLLWLTGNRQARFLGWLCLAGFPISPFFVGEDLLLHQLSEEGALTLLMFLIGFVLNGVVIARSYLESTWLKEARPID